MFTDKGRLDWNAAVKPDPNVPGVLAVSMLYPPAESPINRAIKRTIDELDSADTPIAMRSFTSPASAHLANLLERNKILEEEVSGLRLRVKDMDQLQQDADRLLKEQQDALAEVERDMLEAEQSQEELETVIAMLNASGKGWLSHKSLMNDKNLKKNIAEFSFFPTVEAHNAFFDLINTGGAAENMVLYDTRQLKGARKLKRRARPGARRLLAQDQMLMTFVYLVQGAPMTLIGTMFGGIAVAIVARVITTWINFLFFELHKEFPKPTRAQIQKVMPDKFKHVFGTDLVRQVIDCTEIQMQKATEPMAARCCWSEYKHRYTAKILAGVTPNGALKLVFFISIVCLHSVCSSFLSRQVLSLTFQTHMAVESRILKSSVHLVGSKPSKSSTGS